MPSPNYWTTRGIPTLVLIVPMLSFSVFQYHFFRYQCIHPLPYFTDRKIKAKGVLGSHRKLFTKTASVSLFYHINWRGEGADAENVGKRMQYEKELTEDGPSKHGNGYCAEVKM